MASKVVPDGSARRDAEAARSRSTPHEVGTLLDVAGNGRYARKVIIACKRERARRLHYADVATAFTIEALELVDHYNFLDGLAKSPKAAPGTPPADKQKASAEAGWFLGTTDQWTEKYFDPNDLHSVDRQLFGNGPQTTG